TRSGRKSVTSRKRLFDDEDDETNNQDSKIKRSKSSSSIDYSDTQRNTKNKSPSTPARYISKRKQEVVLASLPNEALLQIQLASTQDQPSATPSKKSGLPPKLARKGTHGNLRTKLVQTLNDSCSPFELEAVQNMS
ncbi:hypothetical protein AKO1_001001, partial [Acrasis kona]